MENYSELKLALPTERRVVERVGAAYLNITRLKNGGLDEAQNQEPDKLQDDENEEIAVDINYLKSLDPKEWKDQDHYKVLGLEKLRYDASDDDIRRAYRRMVLKHHPDKRKAKGEEVDQDSDYLTCITKAYEILGTSKTRRAYDSVDPEFDDDLPTQQQIEQDYYGIFNKYFTLNARWSERKRVPTFGNADAERADVETFYNFWYDFKSWREFSYLDEEDKEKGQNREERRWIDKENKAARIKRKKEEMQRIRALVDLAYNNDKRIAKFKEEAKQRKLAAKRAKMDAAQAQRVEQERAAREAQLERENAERAEQKRIEQIRLEREQLKRALKKERKNLRDRARECNYFASNDKEKLRNMEGIERLCEQYNLQDLQQLNREMQTITCKPNELYYTAIKKLDEQLKLTANNVDAVVGNGIKVANGHFIKEVTKEKLWTPENVQLLIKAVNLFPAGTAQRWDVISAFINQHGKDDVQLTARDVLNKAKAMQQSDFSKSTLKQQANDTAFENFEEEAKKLDIPTSDDITVNNENINNNNINNNIMGNHMAKANVVVKVKADKIKAPDGEVYNNVNENNDVITQSTSNNVATPPVGSNGVSKIWSTEEQALLEQAIKKYPTQTPDRWDCIAACIPNRSKKDCLRRVKELVELVNAKKDAQAAIK